MPDKTEMFRCNGRPVSRDGKRQGAGCRQWYEGTETMARAAGWRIGTKPNGDRDAMCPACAKPGGASPSPRRRAAEGQRQALFELGRPL
jgi:hypothetical protein